MAATPPLLDDRALQQILDQLQELARTHLPEWTPPPEGDPGTMLQRIYARLLELALQRLNQVPEKNLLAFLDTMGVSLLPPAPAAAPLTFGLTAGQPAALVPKGTQAGTQPEGQQPAVLFETDADLTVIPAQLTTGFTMDPQWDRFTDQTPVLAGQSDVGFTPFVGTHRMPHVLYLGEDTVLDSAHPTDVEVIVSFQNNLPVGDAVDLFRRLVWTYQSTGVLQTVPPGQVQVQTPPLTIILRGLTPIDETTIQGVGAAQGIRSRWIQAVLTTPFPDAEAARKLLLESIQIRVSAQGLLPDLAFTNTAPVDVTRDFAPLGDRPRIGDAFFFGSDEVFSKETATVTLAIDLRPHQPELVWEYFDQQDHLPGWKPVPQVDDGTASFLNAGKIGLDIPNRTTGGVVNGVARDHWLRARVAGGGWSGIPKVTGFGFSGGNPVVPPDTGFADDRPLIFTQNSAPVEFSPFGDRPGSGSIFYFGFDKIPAPPAAAAPPFVRVDLLALKVSFSPRAILTWEYLDGAGWQTLTVPESPVKHFAASGSVIFTAPAIPRASVNGQENHWLRVRLTSGDFGREAEFVPVDPDDPSKGFKQRPGTGSFVAPIISSFTISYTVTRPPQVVRQTGFVFQDPARLNGAGKPFAPFLPITAPALAPHDDSSPTFYLGFNDAFPEQPVSLYFEAEARAFRGHVIHGTRFAPRLSSALPPLEWDYFDGRTWSELAVVDHTNNLTESGTVEFLTPPDMTRLAKFDLTERFWVRAHSLRNDPFDTQELQGVFLNTTLATQAVTVSDETLGSSDGQPGQSARLARTPVLPGEQVRVREPEAPSDAERAAIEAEEGSDAIELLVDPATGGTEAMVRWHEVSNFLASDPISRHYTLDHTTGLLAFGDGQRGLVPPRGTNNLIAAYRAGGGPAGDAPRGAIAQITSPLPGVAEVINPAGADGGAPVETVSQVEERGPQTLKHRDRAVAAGDLEALVRQAAGTRVARARCLPNINRDLRFEPGWVTLLIIPQGTEAKLSPSSELLREVENYLEARAFVGLAAEIPARINVIGPGYVQVAAAAEIVPLEIEEAQRVKARVLAELAAFLHPLTGGPDGGGWEFGRDVYASEVCQFLERVPGVDYVKSLRLIPNAAQAHLTSTNPLVALLDLREGSAVMTTDGPSNRRKAALLAEAIPAGTPLDRVAVKGLKAGDRITKVLDLSPSRRSSTAPTDGLVIAVDAFDSDVVGFPRGSLVTTFDGTRQTHLARAIPRDRPGEHEIVVDDAAFVEQLQPTDVLTIFYPFPLTVTAVSLDTTSSVQTLDVEPYEAEIDFPPGSLLAALDNRVRLPLRSTEIRTDGLIHSVQLSDFAGSDRVTIADQDLSSGLTFTLQSVEPVSDIVYLDDNFLVSSGTHQITMVAR